MSPPIEHRRTHHGLELTIRRSRMSRRAISLLLLAFFLWPLALVPVGGPFWLGPALSSTFFGLLLHIPMRRAAERALARPEAVQIDAHRLEIGDVVLDARSLQITRQGRKLTLADSDTAHVLAMEHPLPEVLWFEQTLRDVTAAARHDPAPEMPEALERLVGRQTE